MASAAVMGGISMGSSILGGLFGAKGAANNAEATKLGIQGQMLQTMGQAFGFRTQAQQYDYQANMNKYQAAVAEVNKTIAESNARDAFAVGEVKAKESGMATQLQLGEITAAQGASGLSVAGGSAQRVRSSMVDVGYYNQQTIRSSAAKAAYGFEVEAMQHTAQADMYRYTATMNEDQSKNALTAAGMTEQALPLEQKAMSIADSSATTGIMSSLVGAAGSVAGKWIQGSNMGMWGNA